MFHKPMSKKMPDKFPIYHRDNGDDKLMMLCPLCGYDYTHMLNFVEVKVSDQYTAHPSVRGAVISIPGYCEDGCKFTIFFGQHKGNTYQWAEERFMVYAEDVVDEPFDDLDL